MGKPFGDLKIGAVLFDEFAIKKQIGTGDASAVYLCSEIKNPEKLIALKVLPSKYLNTSERTGSLHSEIIASYRVNHPNVVRSLNVYRDANYAAFSMEYVDGGTLAKHMGRPEKLTIAEVINILQQICSGLYAIHAANIIHRDLKPENILVTTSGQIKITDFGVAVHHSVPNLGEEDCIVGTVNYMSPECILEGKVSRSSDIYAIGVIAYELITGKLPHEASSNLGRLKAKVTKEPIPPHLVREDCPVSLSRIIMNALDRDISKRYQNIKEMKWSLDSLSYSLKIESTKDNQASKYSHDSAFASGVRRASWVLAS